MNARLALRFALVTWLIWFTPPFAGGTSMVPLSIGELAAESDLILHGRVASAATSRHRANRMVTRVGVDVLEMWKGTVSEARVQVTLAGGVLGTRQVIVDGQPDYRPGEEVVLFLKRNPRGEAVTVGLAQGKFTVVDDPNTGLKHVHNPFHGRRQPAPERAQGVVAGPDVLERGLSLAELRQKTLERPR